MFRATQEHINKWELINFGFIIGWIKDYEKGTITFNLLGMPNVTFYIVK